MLFFFDLKIPAAKWAIGWKGFTHLALQVDMPAINHKPQAIEKQDNDPDKQYNHRPATDADQELSKPWKQDVGQGENDREQGSRNDYFGPSTKRANTGPKPGGSLQPIHPT